MSNFLAVFLQEYHALLGVRGDTFKELFRHLIYMDKLVTIVETGCARIPNNWGGDGQSTVLFDRYVTSEGGRLYSVDISPEAVKIARSLVSPRTNLVLNDSVAFLAQFNQPIDLLYLDSFDLDTGNPYPSSKHHLLELCAAQRNLHRGSLVMVDDTYWENDVCVGKGGLVAEYMRAVGATLLMQGYQDLWCMP